MRELLNIIAQSLQKKNKILKFPIPKGNQQNQFFAELNQWFQDRAQNKGEYIYDFTRIDEDNNEDNEDSDHISYCFKFVICDDSEEVVDFIKERSNICERIAFDLCNDQPPMYTLLLNKKSEFFLHLFALKKMIFFFFKSFLSVKQLSGALFFIQ